MERVVKVLGNKHISYDVPPKSLLMGLDIEVKAKTPKCSADVKVIKDLEIMGLALIPCIPCWGKCKKRPCDKCYCSGHIEVVIDEQKR